MSTAAMARTESRREELVSFVSRSAAQSGFAVKDRDDCLLLGISFQLPPQLPVAQLVEKLVGRGFSDAATSDFLRGELASKDDGNVLVSLVPELAPNENKLSARGSYINFMAKVPKGDVLLERYTLADGGVSYSLIIDLLDELLVTLEREGTTLAALLSARA